MSEKIVLDTNVLVSSLWSANGKPSAIVSAALTGRFAVCYDARIVTEYENVLRRPKFKFSPWEVDSLLAEIVSEGISVIAPSIIDVPFVDESDRKFYEVAKFCGATLITGNMKHYPNDECVVTVAEFYEKYFM